MEPTTIPRHSSSAEEIARQEVAALLAVVRAAGHTTLTEERSKEVLRKYGLPTVDEWVVRNTDEAVRRAGEAGYPLVLKGLGPRLTHKTERNLVHLNLQNDDAVRHAAETTIAAAGTDLEGLLLQRQVTGRRELVAGFFRDEQFGPLVMFGLGGVFAEALDDVAFRLAPLDEATARHMISDIRSQPLLQAFRGEEAVHRNSLVRVLMGLSRLGRDHPSIREIDINPLMVSPDGMITAVDALIVLDERAESSRLDETPISVDDVMASFHPRSVAVVGATGGLSKWGFRVLTNLIAGGYDGAVYPVNPKGGLIAGRTAYPSLLDIPGPVDCAVVTVPAAGVIDLIPDMSAKGIRTMILISSGFSETGSRGRQRERELVEAARDAGIVILGPNTMGSCNPHINFFCMGLHVRPRPGDMTLISQSGNMGTQLLLFAEQEGMGIRAFIGSGNEAMVTVEDYLEALAEDELTRTIILYVESVRSGRRFFDAVRRVGREKPVVLLKGGRTEEGKRAAAGHTGALALDSRLFETACRQAGATIVKQPMELVDISACFSSLPLPQGNRVGIMTLGGGWGVVATDLCAEHGLVVPHLPDEMIERINAILPPYWNRSNPVDLVGIIDSEAYLAVMEELLRWDGCDASIHMGIIGRQIIAQRVFESALASDPSGTREFFDDISITRRRQEADFLERMVILMETYRKPIVGVYLHCDGESRTIMGGSDETPYKGVVFRAPEQAVRALSTMYSYHQWLERDGMTRQQTLQTRSAP